MAVSGFYDAGQEAILRGKNLYTKLVRQGIAGIIDVLEKIREAWNTRQDMVEVPVSQS